MIRGIAMLYLFIFRKKTKYIENTIEHWYTRFTGKPLNLKGFKVYQKLIRSIRYGNRNMVSKT